jgi:hypothetical protein
LVSTSNNEASTTDKLGYVKELEQQTTLEILHFRKKKNDIKKTYLN